MTKTASRGARNTGGWPRNQRLAKYRLRPAARRGGAGQDPPCSSGRSSCHRPVGHARRDRAQRVPADPGRPGLRPNGRRGGRGRASVPVSGAIMESWRPSSASRGLPDHGHPAGHPEADRRRDGPRQPVPRWSSATPTGPPNPGTPPAPKQRSPTSASTPAAAKAISRSGTRRPRRSPRAGARSCSGCPRTSWPTASASWRPAGAPAASGSARTWSPALPGVMLPGSVFRGSMLPGRLRQA